MPRQWRTAADALPLMSRDHTEAEEASVDNCGMARRPSWTARLRESEEIKNTAEAQEKKKAQHILRRGSEGCLLLSQGQQSG